MTKIRYFGNNIEAKKRPLPVTFTGFISSPLVVVVVFFEDVICVFAGEYIVLFSRPLVRDSLYPSVLLFHPHEKRHDFHSPVPVGILCSYLFNISPPPKP